MKTNSQCGHQNFENHFPRLIALSLLAMLLLLALTGCQSEPRPAAAIHPAGVYTLISVDGQNVPCQLTHQKTAMIVKSGIFTINPDGTCRSLITFSVPPHQDVNREVNATYTQTGTALTMRWERAGQTRGQINGNSFTMNNEGMVLSYRK